jgi:hypothetical protein
MFPQFETENAAQIPTSFGGLLYMMASVVVIGGVVVLEAVPVYDYLSAKLAGREADPTQMVFWFSMAALLCITRDRAAHPDRAQPARSRGTMTDDDLPPGSPARTRRTSRRCSR